MNSQVTHVTEEDRITVLTLSVHANATNGVVVDGRAVIHPSALHLLVNREKVLHLLQLELLYVYSQYTSTFTSQ
jgi:hypothetical protein